MPKKHYHLNTCWHFQINPNYQDGKHPLESHFPLDYNHIAIT